ncbi:uncharacterized protein TRIADDRAFT_24458 [Trichoplax adhaerens]|uniref:EF-hand domain-containing protein n=1 Tax=Trichoplax adhaerens TaxID=10228 RepID=B3RW52_TRIAD|nr:hypothetical protein TRIADDRAFT_24458 [Trichoplax adhaerens]EDV26117.1 hypothetical protein TRIADDRAFT_24458 [Trichoplax adhaerens]|eukprot:XP_002112150.1 hypothetical protein TRIADDRAFT_24458 [Trichoplax adhaerens]
MTTPSVEDKLRAAAYAAHVQVPDVFRIYDHLRTGFITRSQFLRCLDQSFKLQLNNKDESYLWEQYGWQKPDQINYAELSKLISCNFDPSKFISRPEEQGTQEQTARFVKQFNRQTLSANSERKCLEILRRCKNFCQGHGIDVRSCFQDFDKHREGRVSEYQFYRCFPGPSNVSEADLRLLAARYYDNRTRSYDYIKFQSEILNLGKLSTILTVPYRIEIYIAYILILDAHGIRTTDFFKDYDKHHNGVITENQFLCGLSLVCGPYLTLTRDERQILVDNFKQSNQRVRYREFCSKMENPFVDPDLEVKPLSITYQPPKGALARPAVQLTEKEDMELHRIISEIGNTVRKRRLLLYPYFKDFDKKSGFSRSITRDQFARALQFISIALLPQDLQLLYKRFEHPKGKEIDYTAFIQAVDQEFIASTQDSISSKFPKKEQPKAVQTLTAKSQTSSLDDLIARIKHILLTNRIRAFESFTDFDTLRCGSITENRFRMGLSNMGFSSMGKYNLAESEFKSLCKHYADPNRQQHVLWRCFMDDVDQVFTGKELEKTPSTVVAPSETALLPRLGATNWNNVEDRRKERLNAILHRMKKNIEQRRVLATPFFRDFDKHNHGHVTSFQFRQCLTYMGLHTSDEELQIIEEKFADSEGFNYVEFLQVVQPEKRDQPTYATRLNARNIDQFSTNPSDGFTSHSTEVRQLIDSLKSKVMKERIRVSEFMRDYDRLRSGRLQRATFRRALDLCRFGLNIDQYNLIENTFLSTQQEGYVDYVRFCDEIESAITVKGLEKDPLAEVSQFSVSRDVIHNELTREEQQLLQSVMTKLAERVRQRRIQLFPMFEDYDRVRNGNVSKSQFRRVLSMLALDGAVSEHEFAVLAKKFIHSVGGRSDIDYVTFSDCIYDMCGFEWRKP